MIFPKGKTIEVTVNNPSFHINAGTIGSRGPYSGLTEFTMSTKRANVIQ